MMRASVVDGQLLLFCSLALSSLLRAVRTMPSLSFVEANAREKLVDCFKSSPTEAPVLSLSTTPSRSPALKDNVNRNNTNGSSPGPLSLSLSEISPPKLNTGSVLQLPLSLSSNRETNIQTRLRGEAISKTNERKPKNNPNGRQPILPWHSPRRTSRRNRYPRHQVLHPPPLGTEHGDSPSVPHRRSRGALGRVSGTSSPLPRLSKGRHGRCRTKGSEAEASSLGRVCGGLKCMFGDAVFPNQREADHKLQVYKSIFSPTALSVRFSTLTQKS